MTDWAQVADHGIPTLPGVLDPMVLGKHLEFFSSAPWRWGKLSDVRIQVLRCHSGRRCIFEIALRTAAGVRTLIGKVYALDNSEVFHAMQRISSAGFGAEQEFSIPQPVAYLRELRLLLQEKVPGRPAREIFLTGNESERVMAAERCAKWLARFHATAPKIGPVFDPSDHLLWLEQCSRSVAASGDPLSRKMVRVLHCLKHTASQLTPVETCASHGDFSPAQVILSDGRTATCDWDSCGVADPDRDAGRFLAGLERLGLRKLGSIRMLDVAAEVFLKTYIGLGGQGRELHLRFYKAANHLKSIRRKMVKPDWRERIEVTLDECLRTLTGCLA